MSEEIEITWPPDKNYYYQSIMFRVSEKEQRLGIAERRKNRPVDFCPYCVGEPKIEKLTEPEGYRQYFHELHTCNECGFSAKLHFTNHAYTNVVQHIQRSLLCEFCINDAQLEFQEIGAHLQNNYSDVYAVSPRRFEMLIADVYRNLGYSASLTQQSRDGGYDIVLLQRGDSERILVECKRYSPTRKVSVEIVRQLLGATVDEQTNDCILVTTSTFTEPAIQLAGRVNRRPEGPRIDLVRADELLRSVGSYRDTKPLTRHARRLRSRYPDWTQELNRHVVVNGFRSVGPPLRWIG